MSSRVMFLSQSSLPIIRKMQFLGAGTLETELIQPIRIPHTYSVTGNYAVTFVMTDETGQSTKTSEINVK